MTVKQIRAFLAVAHSLSFALACERLHLSQSALSLTIKALEEGLGGRLFTRNTRNVALTPEGEALLPLARRLIADWDNAEDELRQRFTLQRGRVTLAAMPSFAGNLLPPILKHFRARYPQVNVTVNDVVNEQVLEMVRDREVELGVAFEPQDSTSLVFTQNFTLGGIALGTIVVLVAYHVARAIAPRELVEEDVSLIVVERPGVQAEDEQRPAHHEPSEPTR